MPATVADAVELRVAALSEPARSCSPWSPRPAASGHGVLERCTPDALGPALREALDAGLLVRDRDAGVALRHGLIGEVIYAGLIPAERTALHQAIAAALQEEGAPAAQLADQWHRAGAHAAALAASLEAGAQAADAYAFAEASAHYERALTLWDVVRPAAGDRVALLSRAAQAARHGGDQPRALALGRAALAAHDHAADPERAARLYERLGEYHSWDDEAALECYGSALALLGDEPTPIRARLLAAQGHALMGCAAGRSRASAASRRSPSPPRPATGRRPPRRGSPSASRSASSARRRPASAHLREALETAEGEDGLRAHVHLGELLRLRGDHARALETMELGERAAARLGMRGSFGLLHVRQRDRRPAAARALGRGRGPAAGGRRMDLGVTAATMLHASAAQLHALRGEAAAAREHLEHARACEELGLPGEFATPFRSAAAALALAERDPARRARARGDRARRPARAAVHAGAAAARRARGGRRRGGCARAPARRRARPRR